MKKILCFLCLFLIVSCAGQNTPTVNDQVEVDWVTETDIVSQELDSQQSSTVDLANIVQNIPNVYTQDTSFNSCMTQSINMCMEDFAFQNPEASSCDDFVTSDGREMCNITEITFQAIEAGSTSLCENLPENGLESCKYEVITSIWLETWDFLWCESLREGYINECKNQIIVSNAVKQRDELICNDIIPFDDGLNYEKDFCLEEVQIQIENDAFEEEQERINQEIAAQEAQDLEDMINEQEAQDLQNQINQQEAQDLQDEVIEE